MWYSAIVTREIRPRFALITYLIEPICIFLFGISAPLRITTKWCFRVTDKLGHVTVNLRRIDRIVREIPMVIQRFTVVRVKRVIW